MAQLYLPNRVVTTGLFSESDLLERYDDIVDYDSLFLEGHHVASTTTGGGEGGSSGYAAAALYQASIPSAYVYMPSHVEKYPLFASRVPELYDEEEVDKKQEVKKEPVEENSVFAPSSSRSSSSSAAHGSRATVVAVDPVSTKVEECSVKTAQRRASHNSVERRRRNHINENITILRGLIPRYLFGATPNHLSSSPDVPVAVGMRVTPEPNSSSSSSSSSVGFAKPVHKGVVLRMSVEYIRKLQDSVQRYRLKASVLQSLLVEMGGQPVVIDRTVRRALRSHGLEEPVDENSKARSVSSVAVVDDDEEEEEEDDEGEDEY